MKQVLLVVVVAVALLGVVSYGGSLPQLTLATTITSAASTSGLTRPLLYDINGDGSLDIVTVTSANGIVTVAWYETQKGYNFVQRVIASYAGGIFYHVGVADLDNDNDLDIVYIKYPAGVNIFIPVVLENRQGTWVERALLPYNETNLTDFGLWDYNNDGLTDVYLKPIGENLPTTIFKNNGGLSFSLLYFPYISPIYTYGDLWQVQYNGAKVLVSTSWDSKVGFATYSGTTIGYTTAGEGYNGVSSAIADFNNDGKFDIVAAGNNCWNVQIFLNNGGSTWPAAYIAAPGVTHPASCPGTSRVSAGDIDGDGSPELILSWSTRQAVYNVTSAGAVSAWSIFADTLVTPQHNIGALYQTGFNNKDVVIQDSNGLKIYTTCVACASCTSGSYINSANVCVPCPAGQSSTGYGQKGCFQCPAGTYSRIPGGLCSPCPGGSYSTAIGATSCVVL